MKLYGKRFLFWFLLLISCAGLSSTIADLLLRLIWQRPLLITRTVLLILNDVLWILSVYFWGRYGSDRKKTRGTFYENQPLLQQTLCTLAECPVAEVTSKRHVASPYVQKNGLYLLPDAGASEEDLDRAVAAAAALYAGLAKKETENYPDYSPTYPDHSESSLTFRIRRKSPRVWAVRIKSIAIGSSRTLFFSPDGKTRALKEAAFFPPKQLTEGWFV